MKYKVKLFEHTTGKALTWEFKHHEDAVNQYKHLINKMPYNCTLSLVLPNSGLTDRMHSNVEKRNMGLF